MKNRVVALRATLHLATLLAAGCTAPPSGDRPAADSSEASLRVAATALVAEKKYLEALLLLENKARRLQRQGVDCCDVFLAIARDYADIREPARTEAIYDEVRRTCAPGISGYEAIGNAYLYAGQFSEAIRNYRIAEAEQEAQGHPNRYLLMLEQAYCHFCMGDTAAARAIARKMVDGQTVWCHRAQYLVEILDKADRGGAEGQLEAGLWLLSGSARDGRERLPDGAICWLQKALATPDLSPAKREAATRQLDEALALLRTFTSHSPFSAKRPWTDPVACFPGPCEAGHGLEKEGKLTEALTAYRGFRSQSTCGLGVSSDEAGNAADTARVLTKLGRMDEALNAWKKALKERDDLNAYQLVLCFESAKGLREMCLEAFPKGGDQRKGIAAIEELEAAIRLRDPTRVFDLSEQLRPDFLAHGLAAIGRDSVPECLKYLPKRSLYYDWHDHPERQQKMRAAVIALGAIRDRGAVRPLWKAVDHLWLQLGEETAQALAALRPYAREELMVWLDSSDPEEFAIAVTWLLPPPEVDRSGKP